MADRNTNPQRGEIWFVPTNQPVGSEYRKARPAVVLTEALVVSEEEMGRGNMRLVVPITGWKPFSGRYPWMIPLQYTPQNGLDKDSAADASQIGAASVERFGENTGCVTIAQLTEIVSAVVLCIGYECPTCSRTGNRRTT